MITDTRTHTAISQGPAILRPRQIRALLQAPDLRRRRGRRDVAILAVLAGGGLRVGEAARLTVDSVETGPNGRLRLTLRTGKQRAGTPARWRTVTLPRQAAKLVAKYIDHQQPRYWLFAGLRNEHLCVRQVQKVAARYLREIGRADLHPHSLRHSYGAMVTRETKSIYIAQKMLGHSDPRTTARYYTAFEVSDADEAADAISAALVRRGRNIR